MARPRPIIGINCDYRLAERECSFLYPSYQRAVEAAGGIPLLIPPLARHPDIDVLLGACRGLLLTGGDDIHPRHYGQEIQGRFDAIATHKESADFRLVATAWERDVPILGVCYGMQLLSVLRGGSLIQDLPRGSDRVAHQADGALTRHEVRAAAGSQLADLFGREVQSTNSKHHQAVERAGDDLRVVGTTSDGVVEAIESPNHSFVLGVQWHPELEEEDAAGARLFDRLIAACR